MLLEDIFWTTKTNSRESGVIKCKSTFGIWWKTIWNHIFQNNILASSGNYWKRFEMESYEISCKSIYRRDNSIFKGQLSFLKLTNFYNISQSYFTKIYSKYYKTYWFWKILKKWFKSVWMMAMKQSMLIIHQKEGMIVLVLMNLKHCWNITECGTKT